LTGDVVVVFDELSAVILLLVLVMMVRVVLVAAVMRVNVFQRHVHLSTLVERRLTASK